MNPLGERQRPQVSLELLVRKANQQWSSYGCYSPLEKQLALEDARKLDKDPQILAVRLIKETYDPDDNSSSETVLFASANASISRWAKGFEHRKGDAKSDRGGAAAKQPASPTTPGPKKGRARIVAGLLALLRSMFTVEAVPRRETPRPAAGGGGQGGAGNGATAKPREALEPGVRQALGVIMKFIADAVAVLDQTSLDSYARFGICLYIGGASNLLCRKERLSAEDAATVLATALVAVGLSEERAEGFVEEYESYLLENARNMQMFQAGHDAMIAFRGEGITSEHTLEAALKAWKDQKVPPQGDTRRPLTLMFTDIVGSTAIAEEQGNEHAMKLLRVHNMIVKSAIGHYGGRYVKHTGDGILAAYDDAKMAVKSAAVIQRCVREHNGEFPQIPMHLRIGLNGGDTIAEGDDVFGSSVNLASRLCALAGADQILCTDIVRNRARGGKLRFADRGEHAIKGFKDPIPVHEVLWQDDAAAENDAAAAKPTVAAAE